jgi:enterochelin esterase-like enzyme
VDGKYRTVADRMGRGVGGFSMGAVAAWYVLMAGTEQFHWFMPMSGDCWICGERGGGLHARQTAGLMATALQGRQFYVHVLTGGKDIAFPNLDPQMQAMKEHKDVFGKTVKYSVLPEGVHDYPDIRRYIFNTLPEFF